jgi:hypothetical protein
LCHALPCNPALATGNSVKDIRLSHKQIIELNFLDGTNETSKEEMKENYRSSFTVHRSSSHRSSSHRFKKKP